MRIIEENFTVSCHCRCARDPCLLQARQTLCQRQASKALREGLRERRVGVGAAHVLTIKGSAKGEALCRCLCHDIDPAVMHLIQSVKGIEAILSLICQTTRRFASVPGEPLGAKDNTAIE